MKYVLGTVMNFVILGFFLSDFMFLLILPEPRWYTLPSAVIMFVLLLGRMKWTF